MYYVYAFLKTGISMVLLPYPQYLPLGFIVLIIKFQNNVIGCASSFPLFDIMRYSVITVTSISQYKYVMLTA